MKRMSLLLLFVLAVGALIAACGGGGKTNEGGGKTAPDDLDRPDPPVAITDLAVPEFTKEMEKEGEKRFQILCQTCHGAEGKGDGDGGKGLNPLPQDLTNPKLQAALSDHYIYWRIMEGGAVLGYNGMTPFKEMTTPEERWQLVAFVRTLDD